MLPPIPEKILRTTALVKVCTALDLYQNQVYTEYTVTRVHLQPVTEIRKTTANTSQLLKSTLFVDVRHSKPLLDWDGLLRAAHQNGGDMRVVVRGVEYTVVTVDALRDDSDRLHHYEVGLV